MCGIAGYIVTQANDRVRLAISILALEMEDRGSDSWGMFYGTPKESLAVHRVASSVRKSFDLPVVLPLAMAVHTRHATTGEIKAGNAHPFTVKGELGTVVGMHNGIISNHRELKITYGRKCRVDSEHIFAHIADGIALSDIQGYGTVVYSHNGQWFIGKFQGGELAIVTTEFGVFFSSTESSLQLALRMAGIPILKWLTTKDGTLYALDTKGIHNRGNKLDVASDLFCGKWDDDIAPSDDPLDEDYVHFISEGRDECEGCNAPVLKGEDLYYTESLILCKTCFFPSKEETR